MKTMMFVTGQPLAADSLSPDFDSVMALPEGVPVGSGGGRRGGRTRKGRG